MEVSCAVIHASCYFLNNFQHFTGLFWIIRKEKLKGVRHHQNSHFISTLLFNFVFFVPPKVMFVLVNKKIQACLILLFCYSHSKFFWMHQVQSQQTKSFWCCSFGTNALLFFLKALFNHWGNKKTFYQKVMISNCKFVFFQTPTPH